MQFIADYKLDVNWDAPGSEQDTTTPLQLVQAMWPLHYYGVSCNEDSAVCHYQSPVYQASQTALKAMLHHWISDVPVEFIYEKLIECGELLSEQTIRELWAEELDSIGDLIDGNPWEKSA